MNVALGILLLLNALYNVVTWPQFLRRVTNDPRARDEQGNATKFLRVHQVLVAIALVIAAISAVFGVWALFV